MKHGRVAVLCLALLSLVGGCGGDNAGGGGTSLPAASKTAVYEAADNSAGQVHARVGGVVAGEPGTPLASPGQVPVPQERKLMREGQATLKVASVDAALARLRQLTQEAGGYTASESRSRDDQRVNHGQIECRIPAGKLDTVAAALKSLGTLESLTLLATDITEEYFDLDIRLRNQRALETRLLALLERPTNKLSDLLEAERELARVRGEIDQMEGRKRFWDNRVALSSLSVTVHEAVPTVGGDQGGALSMLREAFANSANNFVSAIAAIIAVAGGLVPVVAALALVGWILARLWRRRRVRRTAKPAAENAAVSADEKP